MSQKVKLIHPRKELLVVQVKELIRTLEQEGLI